MKRSEIREETVKRLYSYFVSNEVDRNYEEAYIKELVEGVILKEDELKKIANSYLKEGWDIDRLSLVDKAIIYVALYELKYTSLPYKVVIDEALNLSKKYSDEKIKDMINAVLDSYYKDHNGR